MFSFRRLTKKLQLMTKRQNQDATQVLTKLPLNISFEDTEIPENTTKISSWNVASINACMKKGFKSYVDAEKADILCLQETKSNSDNGTILKKSEYPFQYQSHCTVKKGYAGTAVFSKIEPIKVIYKIGDKELDEEGRFIILEFKDYYLIACYIINAGQNLERLDLKREHYKKLSTFLSSLDEKKPVILCGGLKYFI